MSSALNDLLVTDADLDLIARREYDGDDFVLSSLAAFAQFVEDEPLPSLDVEPATTLHTDGPQMSHAHRGGFALAATVVLVLSSSGVAAAMSGDPLAPLHYVAKRVLDLGPHGSSQMPGWDLDGSGEVSSLRATGIGRPQTARVPVSDITSVETGRRFDGSPVYGVPGRHHRSDAHGPGLTGPPGAPVSGGGSSGGERSHAGGGQVPSFPRRPGRSQGGDPVSPILPTDPRHGHGGSTGMSNRSEATTTSNLLQPVRSPAAHRERRSLEPTGAATEASHVVPGPAATPADPATKITVSSALRS